MKHSDPPPQVHEPFVHPSVTSESQVRPQLPQLFLSERVFLHVPEQHSSVPGHTRPQAPQFATVFTFVQVPLQHCSAAEQARAPVPVPQRHCDPEQVVPAGQLTVQLVTHVPPVHTWPLEHAAPVPQRHTPPTQTSPVPHAGVHATGPVSVTAASVPPSLDVTNASVGTPVSVGYGASGRTT